MISKLRLLIGRRGGPRVVLEGLLVIQLLHLGEHVAQMVQLHVLGWPPAIARGVVSNLDVEKVHFVWNLAVLATLLWLVARGLSSGRLVATLVWALLHTSEHGFLLTRALLSGVEGAPGILGAGGWLARQGWDMPGLTTWTRATVHFAWNTVEVALLALAYATVAGARVRPPWAPVRAAAEGGATLALVLLIPSTAGAPVETLTALAPVEIWVDGFDHVAGLAVDGHDNLYVSDRNAGTVTRVTPDRHRAVVAAGLDHPVGLALDRSGRLLIAEEGAGRVVRVEVNGARAPLVIGIRHPRWLAMSEAGVLFISARRPPRGARDDDPMTVLALGPSGQLEVFADDFRQLEALVADNGQLFVAARGQRGERGSDGAIFRIPVSANGTAGAIGVHGPRDLFRRPVGLARDHLGALYLTAEALLTTKPIPRNAIAKLHPAGAVTPFAADLRDPHGIAFDGEGHLYVADGRAGRVLRFRAPQPPALQTLAAFTNQSAITVRGTTEAHARADLFTNDAPAPITAVAGASGAFTLTSPLVADMTNIVEVFVTPHRGDGLTSLSAEASVVHDGLGPSVVFQAPAAGGFVRDRVTVQASATDAGAGVAGLAMSADGAPLGTTLVPPPPAATVTGTATWSTADIADGTRTLSAVASDRAGNVRTVTRAVVVDNTAPDTQVVTGPSGDIAEASATFTFTGTDTVTPTGGLAFAWRLDGAAFGAFSTATTASFSGLAEGDHTFEVTARDQAGNEDPTPAIRSFRIGVRPTVSALDPSSGPAGTLVTITGGGFGSGAQVSFSGVAAVVRSVTPTTITATVPLAALSGPVTVATAQGSATSAQPFTVTTSQDFSVRAMPTEGSIVQGGSTTYTISLQHAAAPFSGLATLSMTGLPSGVTGSITPAATLSGGQLRTLTVTATPSAVAGLATLTITASGSVDGVSLTRTAAVTLSVLPGSRTAALGQITFDDGAPIAGVRLTLGGATTTSDAGGNFQLLDVPAGAQMLGIDANAAQTGLPIYGVDVTLVAGQATRLAPFRITPPPPPERFVAIANGAAAQVITDPRYPGASITLPAGVTIAGWDGTAKTRIAIERLSPEALPVPPPPGPTRSLYQVFFGTPMGGLPSAPLPVSVPNDQDLEPGEKAEIWYYDAAPVPGVPAGWRLAGLGTVTADGSRVVSDPGVGISRFCGVCGVFCIVKNVLKQSNVNPLGPKAGEPVDLGSGLMLVDKVDLVLPGRVPAVVRRTYNPQDVVGRIAGFELATGPGWMLGIDVVLLEESPSLRRLILPGNSRFAFALQPDGTFANATFPDFAGAVLRAHDDRSHTLRFKDGAIWRFASGYVPRNGPPIVISGLSLLVARSDRIGNTLTITRDRFGAPARVTEPGGRSLTFVVDLVDVGVARLLAVTDPLGRTVRYGYSVAAPFRLETVADPIGGLTRYAYEAAGGLVSLTDPRGVTILTNEHDAHGRVIRQTQADGGVWTFTYSGPVGAHTAAAVTDPRGGTTAYRLDSAGFGTEIVDALGQAMRYDRDPVGRVTATTDPLGRVTRLTYDAVGNLLRITDPAGNTRTFTYEPTFNRITSSTDPLGNVTRFEHDGGGNLAAVVDPLGNRMSLAYDSVGQLITATDALGNSARFEHDTVGNLIATVDPLGHRTTREYDAVSRLARERNALGQVTTIGYDSLDRVETILDARGGVTRFAHDPTGNVLGLTDARGGLTVYTYDAMGRLETRTDPVGARESFAYDGLGNPTRHTDRRGRVSTFTYDRVNRRASAVYADATLRLTYDAAGRMSEAEDSLGGMIAYRYDALDRLASETTPLGTIGYEYDALSRRTAMTMPGQPPVTYTYDIASRPTTITHASQEAQLEHDAAGRRTRLTLPNQVSTHYAYDTASRLTGLTYRSTAGLLGNLAYQYDAAGNRLAVSGSLARTLLPVAIESASYDAANRQLAFGDKAITHDANGNVTSITDPSGTTSLAWDSRDRLTGVTTPSESGAWTYDPSGRRVRARINGTTLAHLYDGHDIVQTQSSEGTTTFLRTLAIDEPLARDASEFYLTDALGSTLALTTADGSPLTRYLYDPFGRSTSEGADSPNPFQFTSRENDTLASLYSYRLRTYSPTLHRFISEDPLSWLAGPNAYAYARNSPQRFTDPLGLEVQVVLYQGATGNIFEHVGIGVDSNATVGFYPQENSLRMMLSETVPGIVRPDSNRRLATVRIQTTTLQDAIAQEMINEAVSSRREYNLLSNSCAIFVQDILRAIGIQVPNTRLPRYLIWFLQEMYDPPRFVPREFLKSRNVTP